MKILVTGANGQLGSELKALAPHFPGSEFTFTDVAELDITNEEEVGRFMLQLRPYAVINCAAYTAVDKAEQEEALAFRINAAAPGILARAASAADALLVHISTDYVFDGKSFVPYTETDPTSPVSAYARSKHAGEEEVRKAGGRSLIIRTSWLYSAFGHNFVKTILRYGRERGKLNVVFDQAGSPTWAGDLAQAILEILAQRPVISGTEIYHYANEGVASWYDFALAITELAGLDCVITPIETKDYPLPAVRPFYSVFNKALIRERFGLRIPYWRDSLKICIEQLTA